MDTHSDSVLILLLGLSQPEIESLFVPFQQADNSSTRRFGGTGLGLSISRELIKLMDGHIGVQSEIGVGSSFWFTIPVKVHESLESERVRKNNRVSASADVHLSCL